MPAIDGGITAVVVKGYPRLSETFIAQELHGLEARGLRLHIYSLRLPYDPAQHPIHDEIAAPVSYLPEYLWRAPLRVLRAWWAARRLPGYAAARGKFLHDLLRDPTPNRMRRFGQACVLAREIDPAATQFYAHFLHTPASVARYAAAMLSLPYMVSAHAKDIWTSPDWEKQEKIADAKWITTCTGTGADHLRPHAEAAGRPADTVRLNYHGLDLARFPLPAEPRPPRTGGDADAPLQIVSVGRLVAKKGYDDLLAALALLPADFHWRLLHIGGGPLRGALESQARDLGIADRIAWQGRQPQDQVLAALRAGDLFVLASRVAEDGDRDGLPNVLMEAQSQKLACIATRVSAIPELIEDGATGLLVPPGAPQELAAAIRTLGNDPARRTALGEAALQRLRNRFGMDTGLDALAADLGLPARQAAAQ